ncbi:hypothetical protein SEA_CASSITA_82 [Microbacterium phage Cassita]|nr:hypothetical protein SEA_CASSITA_82 [Microbacterium phage Cassita]
MTDDQGVETRLTKALLNSGANFADPVDGDVYVEWYLSDLLEFCRDWRSEIEELR